LSSSSSSSSSSSDVRPPEAGAALLLRISARPSQTQAPPVAAPAPSPRASAEEAPPSQLEQLMRAVASNEWVAFGDERGGGGAAGGRRSFVSIVTGERRDELPPGATATRAVRSLGAAAAAMEAAEAVGSEEARARTDEKIEMRFL